MSDPKTIGSAFIYVIPFFILVPFACRVAYYRVWHMYLSAYINIFYGTRFSFGDEELDSFFIPQISLCCKKYSCIPHKTGEIEEVETAIKIQNEIYKHNGCSILDKVIHHLMCFFVNFELFILSLACLGLFFIRTYNYFDYSSGWFVIYLISVVSTVLIFAVSYNGYSYGRGYRSFERQWKICKMIYDKRKNDDANQR